MFGDNYSPYPDAVTPKGQNRIRRGPLPRRNKTEFAGGRYPEGTKIEFAGGRYPEGVK